VFDRDQGDAEINLFGSIDSLEDHARHSRSYRVRVGTSVDTASTQRRVKVCVASFNTRRATELCIRSMRQFAGHPFELTVGDSGSTDGSIEMLRSFEARGWLSLEVAPEGRKHGEWLTTWHHRAQGEYLVFVDSDMEFRRYGWLHDLVTTAERNGAAVVTGKMCRERPFEVEPVRLKTVRLASRPAPWLLLVDSQRTAGISESFSAQKEITDAVPEGLIVYDVGARFFHSAVEQGFRCVEMPEEFRPAFHHYSGLSWVKMKGRRGLKMRRDLWTLSRHLRRLRRLQEGFSRA